MVRADQITTLITEAARAGDALQLRSLIQDWLAENPCLAMCPKPELTDSTLLAISAGIVELLAQRRGEPAPAWAKDVGPSDHPVYLLKSAETMPRLRHLCETESPLPLRRRNLFAPPTFLEFV